MMNTYKLAKARQTISIASLINLNFVLALPLFSGNLSGDLSGYIFALLFLVAISVAIICGIVTSKIVTSPEGIKNVSFGMRSEATWDKFEKIDGTSDGLINLVFKESIYKSKFARTLMKLFTYDRIIQLAYFIDDIAASNLLKDIAEHTPNSNVPEFVAQQKQSIRTYQKAGVIGLYYFDWFLAWSMLALVFQHRVEEYLATLRLPNTDVISRFVTPTLWAGLFVNAMILLTTNKNKVSRKARTHYLSPFILVVISLLIGVGMAFLKARYGERVEFPAYLLFLAGPISLWVSSIIERLLFRDNIQ